MADEQDRAEAFDDDKGAFPSDERPVVDLIDQTADADPGTADHALAAIDADESGDGLEGVEADPGEVDDPFHSEEPAPEVAAMHITDQPG